MADPLSVIGSLVGVITGGIQLSRSLYEIVQLVKNAPLEITELASEVSFLSHILSNVSDVLQEGQRLYTKHMLWEIEQITLRIQVSHKELRKMTQTGRNRSVQRLQWMYQSGKAKDLKIKIEGHKTALGLVLSTMQLALHQNNVLRANEVGKHNGILHSKYLMLAENYVQAARKLQSEDPSTIPSGHSEPSLSEFQTDHHDPDHPYHVTTRMTAATTAEEERERNKREEQKGQRAEQRQTHERAQRLDEAKGKEKKQRPQGPKRRQAMRQAELRERAGSDTPYVSPSEVTVIEANHDEYDANNSSDGYSGKQFRRRGYKVTRDSSFYDQSGRRTYRGSGESDRDRSRSKDSMDDKHPKASRESSSNEIHADDTEDDKNGKTGAQEVADTFGDDDWKVRGSPSDSQKGPGISANASEKVDWEFSDSSSISEASPKNSPTSLVLATRNGTIALRSGFSLGQALVIRNLPPRVVVKQLLLEWTFMSKEQIEWSTTSASNERAENSRIRGGWEIARSGGHAKPSPPANPPFYNWGYPSPPPSFTSNGYDSGPWPQGPPNIPPYYPQEPSNVHPYYPQGPPDAPPFGADSRIKILERKIQQLMEEQERKTPSQPVPPPHQPPTNEWEEFQTRSKSADEHARFGREEDLMKRKWELKQLKEKLDRQEEEAWLKVVAEKKRVIAEQAEAQQKAKEERERIMMEVEAAEERGKAERKRVLAEAAEIERREKAEIQAERARIIAEEEQRKRDKANEAAAAAQRDAELIEATMKAARKEADKREAELRERFEKEMSEQKLALLELQRAGGKEKNNNQKRSLRDRFLKK